MKPNAEQKLNLLIYCPASKEKQKSLQHETFHSSSVSSADDKKFFES